MKKVVKKSKKIVSERSKLELILFALLLLVTYLFLSSRYEWWPWNITHNELGTAFYVNDRKDAVQGTRDAIDSINRSGPPQSGSNGISTRSDDNRVESNSKTSRLKALAAKINVGMTKAQLSEAANSLGERCTVIADSSSTGRQQVCVYSEVDKIITVTLLNDRVVSASRSGF